MSLLSIDEAIARLRANSRVLVVPESCQLQACRGRTLASDIKSDIDVPPADNSAMDGYALRRQDWHGPDQALEISQRIVAGTPPEPLMAGTAARIFTGAEIPAGADMVVMQERCRVDGQSVRIEAVGESGANIRPQGQDIQRGATVLKKGHRLRAQDLGLIASLGIARIEVLQRLKVAIISTGSELAEPGEAAKPGQIYNSNRYMMAALLQQWDFEVVDLGITEDDRQTLTEVMRDASRKADVMITSGGVSVGEEDHVKAVVEALGHIDMWRIAIKPGKPFAYGEVLGTPFIGLPGNPVSALVTLLVIARAFLFDSQGVVGHEIVPVRQVALFDKKGTARQEYLRVRSGPTGAEIFPQQSSGVLYSTTWGDGLVVQKMGEDIVHGGLVDVIPYALFN